MPTETVTTVNEKVLEPVLSTAGTEGQQPLPYWLVNVPRDQWPSSCPDYLKDISEKNIGILSTPDSQYQWIGWDRVREIVKSMNIGQFQRLPTDLRRYLKWLYYIQQKYGSIMEFVLNERLHWGLEGLQPKGEAFEYEKDIKILFNDWPYGLEKGIVHLVVWTKFDLDEDPATGLLTDEMWRKIDNFVENKFRSRMASDQIVWFKNWKSLKSVHAVEHFHIMLHHPHPDFIREITNGDVPLVEKLSQETAP